MSGETPEEQEPCADVGHDGEEEPPVDGSLALAGFDPELLLQLAETIGNPLVLLVSKVHLSKAFLKAAQNAQGLLKHVDLREWAQTVDDAVVAAVVSKCSQLSSLNLEGCSKINDAAVLVVAAGCLQLTTLSLSLCGNITDAAIKAVASGCKQLTTLDLSCCTKITDAAVLAVASRCKQLTSLDLGDCGTRSPTQRWWRSPRAASSSRISSFKTAARHRRGGGGGGLGVQAAHDAQPAWLPQHHSSRGES